MCLVMIVHVVWYLDYHWTKNLQFMVINYINYNQAKRQVTTYIKEESGSYKYL